MSVSRRLEESCKAIKTHIVAKRVTKKNESFGRVQKRKIYLTTTLQKTRSKSEKRDEEARECSGELIFKKLRPRLFFCARHTISAEFL